jgi:hypothetical protein
MASQRFGHQKLPCKDCFQDYITQESSSSDILKLRDGDAWLNIGIEGLCVSTLYHLGPAEALKVQ